MFPRRLVLACLPLLMAAVGVSSTGATFLSTSVYDTADANSNQGVASVRMEVRPSTGVWAPLCAETSAPYSCSWSTSTSGSYDVRAVPTQGNGATLVSSVVSVTVDNSVLRAQDVQAVNSGTSGLASAGDRLVLTYTTQTVSGVQVTVVTITLGTTTQAAILHATTASAAMTWTPTAQVMTSSGLACSTTAAVESGATDRDL